MTVVWSVRQVSRCRKPEIKVLTGLSASSNRRARMADQQHRGKPAALGSWAAYPDRETASALRLHVVTDRPVSERLREIESEETREKVPVTFQIWDLSRLKRIHDAHSVRDDC